MNDTEKILFRPRTVAVMYDMSVSQVYKLIANGTLPSVRLGGSVRVPAEQLRDFVSTLA
ncbi:MAG: helix-turn-helix transcriptional regulator [Bryobacteraceae bacterium]